MTDSGASLPVRGLSSLGTASTVIVRRAAPASTRMVWMLRSTRGSAQICTRVRAGPIPASASAAATFALAGNPAAASSALPSKMQVGSLIASTSMPILAR